MTVEEFRKTMAEVEYIPAGSELHQAFHAFSQEALKITAELNGLAPYVADAASRKVREVR